MCVCQRSEEYTCIYVWRCSHPYAYWLLVYSTYRYTVQTSASSSPVLPLTHPLTLLGVLLASTFVLSLSLSLHLLNCSSRIFLNSNCFCSSLISSRSSGSTYIVSRICCNMAAHDTTGPLCVYQLSLSLQLYSSCVGGWMQEVGVSRRAGE